MSLNLEDARLFMAVVDAGSITAAAEALDMPQPTISRRIKNLEQHLGLRLFERAGRSIKLSNFGHQFLNHCQRIHNAVTDAESFAENSKNKPSGSLEIEAPYLAIEMMLEHLVPQFARQYPDIQLTFTTITAEHHKMPMRGDLRLSAIELADEQLICRPCYSYDFCFFAAPQFIAQYGMPNHPTDLVNYPCIGFPPQYRDLVDWHYQESGQEHSIAIKPSLTVDHVSLMTLPAVAGLGVIMSTMPILSRQLKSGALVPLFDGKYGFNRTLHICYRSRTMQPLREKVFIDALLMHIAEETFTK
ncbi:LysR family transcriptional regulator [Neiella sp. HB171785]|uniref:LysR family transcriptional regulator n=1 Tax=Neiella litorisoli TaxID=2771431 RepID=A0A8J6QMH0_9GAMM|nr:LysR family transcriptional regulator [Neiella litorisoli]MBD1391167.1 LysR family transcriptional regulator [Neiella litorisoli]